MVFGTTLRVPGEFFNPPSTSSLNDPLDFVSQLKAHMQQLHVHPSPPRSTPWESHVSDVLSSCTHVFLSVDKVHVQYMYVTHYSRCITYVVEARTGKHFTIGRKETVSLVRLKPAHLDSTPNVPFHLQYLPNHKPHSTSLHLLNRHLESHDQDNKFTDRNACTPTSRREPLGEWCSGYTLPIYTEHSIVYILVVGVKSAIIIIWCEE